MKRSNPIPKLLLLSLSTVLMACSFSLSSSGNSATDSNDNNPTTSTVTPTGSQGENEDASVNSNNTTSTSVAPADSVPSASFSSVEVPDTGNADNLTVTTSDGAYTIEGSTVKITTSGTYKLSGELNGMVYVDAGDDDEIEIVLNGVTISNSSNSPIYINNASEVKIKAQKNTVNTISDNRAQKTVDAEDQGEGAIYSKCDLKLTGTGTLNVTGSYNHGIHTNDDLTIKNQTLSVSSPNHAVKGKDSITIEEGGTFVFVSTGGDGLKTENSDISSKGNQRGDITITAGNIAIYSATDGIDAAHDVIIKDGVDDTGAATTPTINITTNKYSSYTGTIVELTETVTTTETVSYFGPGGGGPGGGGNPWNPGGGGNNPWNPGGNSNPSASNHGKGIKSDNSIYLQGGYTTIKAANDGVHANYGTTLENGSTGVGDIEISGGTLTITADDDGIHADRYLKISGGTSNVNGYEGLEGNQILISGGSTYVVGSDDAVNATSGSLSSILYKQTGGYLFAEVSSNGDVDGIDSNGSYTLEDGVCVVAGPAMGMASALDTDGAVTVKGGTLAIIGGSEKTPSYSGVTRSSKSASYNAGSTYTITFANGSVTTGSFAYSHSGITYGYSSLGSITSISKN